MRLTLRGALAAAFVLVMCGVCVRLGFWQLDRLKQRRARNHEVEVAQRMPVLDFDSMTAAAIERQPELFINRTVRVTGTYDPTGEVILRGRASEGSPGVHLVTPILVRHVPQALLVNRGWVPSPDAATVDAGRYAEPGTRTVVGILMQVPKHTNRVGHATTTFVNGRAVRTYRRLDLEALQPRYPRPLLPLYVQQLPGPDAASGRQPVRVPPPVLDNGPHLSYAVQWFSFAAIGVVGLVVVLVRQRRAGEG
jgi:surfeit locus 1 family protein